MINLETMLSTAPREAGVVYTKPWVVELVLDLAFQQDRLFNKKVLDMSRSSIIGKRPSVRR
jgi:hypothetical protein